MAGGPEPERTAPNVLDAVFAHRTQASGPGKWAPWLVAIGAHVTLFAVASRTEPSLETWSARMAAVVHDDLTNRAPIAIEAPPPVEPEPQPETTPEPPPPEPRERSIEPPTPPAAAPRPERAPSTPPGEPQPPAQASDIVSAEADSLAPVDLTENTFVTGKAATYAGGVTTRDGESRNASRPRPVERPAPPDQRRGASRASPVQLSESEWRCPWTSEALLEGIREAHVNLTVVVRADGTVESATLLSDPGYGLGSAARSCALRTRFTPARDAEGRPVRATSPPIRVRFTR